MATAQKLAVTPIDNNRIWRAGLLAGGASIVVNLLVQVLAKALFNISSAFTPFANPGPVITLTLIGVIGATIVFALVARRAKDPLRVFQRIALVVLVVSLIPDLGAFTQPGATVAAVISLMLMHLLTFTIVVTFFGRFARAD